jgi:hypothetical protein
MLVIKQCIGVGSICRTAVVGVTIVCALWFPPQALAQQSPAASDQQNAPAPERLDLSSNDITNELRSTLRRPASFLYGPIARLTDAWDRFSEKLDDKIGLLLGITYKIVYQHATEAIGPRDAAGGDFNFFGT